MVSYLAVACCTCKCNLLSVGHVPAKAEYHVGSVLLAIECCDMGVIIASSLSLPTLTMYR